MIDAFIPARMSSERFPGKVLAPFHGRPIIAHVVDRVREVEAIADRQIVLLTTTDACDDSLASYGATLGVEVFRGPRDDVFERFQRCAAARPAEWIVRINADSPLMSPGILRAVIARAGDDCDLVTTIAPRTLPKGQNPEMIRAAVLASTPLAALSADDREHVTPFFYRHPDRFRIVNLRSDRPGLVDVNLSVDSLDDLRRLESMPQSAIDELLDVSLV